MVFISNRNDLLQQQHMVATRTPNATIKLNSSQATAGPTTMTSVKYTKIYLTKRSDPDDRSGPVVLTKNPRRAVAAGNYHVDSGARAKGPTTSLLGELLSQDAKSETGDS